MVGEKVEVFPEDFVLLSSSRELELTELLRHCNIQKDSTVEMRLRVPHRGTGLLPCNPIEIVVILVEYRRSIDGSFDRWGTTIGDIKSWVASTFSHDVGRSLLRSHRRGHKLDDDNRSLHDYAIEDRAVLYWRGEKYR